MKFLTIQTNLCDYVDWYGAIASAIYDLGKLRK